MGFLLTSQLNRITPDSLKFTPSLYLYVYRFGLTHFYTMTPFDESGKGAV